MFSCVHVNTQNINEIVRSMNLSQYMNPRPNMEIALSCDSQKCAAQMYSQPHLQAGRRQHASVYQNYYARYLERGSRKYKPFHTRYTCAFASTQRTLSRQTERSCGVLLFMRNAGRGKRRTCLLACTPLFSEHLLC